MSFHDFVISTFSYIYKKNCFCRYEHKICNGCGAKIERCFAYKIKNYLIETLY